MPTPRIRCTKGLITLASDELRQLSAALEAASDGVVASDATQKDNPLVFASPGFLRLTGYQLKEVPGRNCGFLQGKDTDLATTSAIRNAIAEARPFSGENLNYRRDWTNWPSVGRSSTRQRSPRPERRWRSTPGC